MSKSFLAIRNLVLMLAAFVAMPLMADPAAAPGATVEVENKAYYLCKHSKEVRTIRVQVDEGVCTTFYSKQGSEKNVGSGKNQESCVNFMNNIKTNLEKSNWSCRDVGSTRITASVE